MPALILQCSDDVIAPYAVGEYVHRHMANSQLVVMEATGHCPNLSAPEETVGAIKAFHRVAAVSTGDDSDRVWMTRCSRRAPRTCTSRRPAGISRRCQTARSSESTRPSSNGLGASREALLAGTKFQTLLSIGSRIYYETHYAPLLRMQGFANEIALEMIRGDGRILPVLVNSRQKRDAAGTPLFNRITLFDATDRRRYERELLLARRKAEQVAKDKADLLAMLSHDIRNPLNALMGVVQLLDRSELSEQQRRFVRLLKSSSENMLNLLNHVLELSKAESSSFALVETPFSLHTLVDDVVSTFDAAAREKSVTLRSGSPTSVPAHMLGDPVAIRQILANLVGNAVKFTPSGSVTLTVGAKEVGTDAVTLAIAVSDTGIGIAPDVVDRIFNEFTQASYETADAVRRDRSGPDNHPKAARAVRQHRSRRERARRGFDVLLRLTIAAVSDPIHTGV